MRDLLGMRKSVSSLEGSGRVEEYGGQVSWQHDSLCSCAGIFFISPFGEYTFLMCSHWGKRIEVKQIVVYCVLKRFENSRQQL